MTAAAHTAGPWEARKSHYSDHLSTVFGADGSYVAVTDNSKAPVGDPEKYEANTRLIAAAPDLLEQLTLALPYVESALEDRGYKPGSIKIRTEAIRAAIARATP